MNFAPTNSVYWYSRIVPHTRPPVTAVFIRFDAIEDFVKLFERHANHQKLALIGCCT
jgi:hypothetical protein